MKSVLKFFIPSKDYSFEQLDKLSGKKNNLWTWSQRAKINMHKMGFEIVEIENWDIEEFVRTGKKYLEKRYGKEVADIQEEHSDLEQAITDYDDYGRLNILQNKIPTLNDIQDLLEKGYLVCCNVNSKMLNSKPGYSGHFVTLIGFDDKYLYLHDPGLPPQENRKVSFKDFTKAWAFPDENAQNLTAFKL
jgi:hypothetical protein